MMIRRGYLAAWGRLGALEGGTKGLARTAMLRRCNRVAEVGTEGMRAGRSYCAVREGEQKGTS
eukprot:1161102-Pelagomonas_calceolata.AAC.2